MRPAFRQPLATAPRRGHLLGMDSRQEGLERRRDKWLEDGIGTRRIEHSIGVDAMPHRLETAEHLDGHWVPGGMGSGPDYWAALENLIVWFDG